MAQHIAGTSDLSPFEVEGEEWETICPGVKRRIIPSDMGIPIVPEDPAETLLRLRQAQIIALPDEEWAPIVLRSVGAKGLDRAGTLARARKRLRGYPQFAEYNSDLEWAISRDTTELLQGILEASGSDDGHPEKSGAFDPNTVSSCQSALFHAVSGNKIDNARLLLDHGADPNMYSIYENENDEDPWQLPLHCAARNWRSDSIQLLIERGTKINAKSLLRGQTALHHAILTARFTVQDLNWSDLELTVRCLMSAGADVNIRDENLHSPLDIWLGLDYPHQRNDMRPVARLLLEAGADISAAGIVGNSSFLISAALDGSSNLFRLLLESGDPKVNGQNEEGETALHLLTQRGALEDVNLLLKAGANPNIQSAGGETPLHRAAERRGYHEIAKALLNSADPTIRRGDGKTAIELALLAGGIKETMKVFAQHEPSRSFMAAEREKLKAAALASGTSLSRFDDLMKTQPTVSLLERLSSASINTSPISEVVVSALLESCLPHMESTAFAKSAERFERLMSPILRSAPVRIVPKRLIDVTTGKIVPGENSVKYIIGSYLWSPEKTPGLPQDLNAYGRIPETSKRVVEACRKHPDLIEMIPPDAEKVSAIKLPARKFFPTEPNSAYLSVVYQLLGREAYRRGVRFVWIDSFCINQTDETDKAEQIPLMADYYKNAECCVVISESLRRHILPEFDPSRVFFKSGDSITDRILAWAIGFHFNRIWVLQETRLAKEVVTRSGNVRIRTTELLSPNFVDGSPSTNKLWRFAFRKGEGAEETKTAIGKAIQKLPLSESRLGGDLLLSLDFCMMLLRDRGSLRPHDKIFGILGLFPPSIRNSVPIDYNLSLSAVFAIFVYLRTRCGELIGLLNIRATDQPPHSIQDAPSWLPSGYGFNYCDILDLQVDPSLDFRIEHDRKMYLRLGFLRIADCYRLEDNVFGGLPNANYGNIVLRFMDKNRKLLPEFQRAAVEPVDPDYALTSDTSFGTVATHITRPPIMPTQLSASDAAKVAEERELRRMQIQIAARQDSAVVAMLGTERRGEGAFALALNTAWMILCTEDEGRTWRKHGLMAASVQKAESLAGPNGLESREFCVV